jgi:basic amino acid/polyamine antiporter, APA family
MNLWARKSVAELSAAGDSTEFRRHLGLGSLVLLGVGAVVGAGIFVITGTAAANYAGPAVALSFLIAGVGCLCAALCYAELSSMIPVAGSAYTYSYATLGEFVAWIVGWNLLLEYLLGAATIAVGWSGYLAAALAQVGLALPPALAGGPLAGGVLNLPACLVLLGLSFVLHRGIRASARFNAATVTVKIAVVLLVIGFGAFYVQAANWQPFLPANTGVAGEFGWSGVMRAAGVVFFAYIGFDMLSSSAQEAINPRRNVPLSLLITLAICTALYMGMSLVVTGLAPYTMLDVPHPVFVAVEHAGAGLAWLKPLISISVIFGLCSGMLVCLYGQARILYAMGRDGLLPRRFAAVNARYGTPGFGTWSVGISAAVLAALLPIQILGELLAIGTLLAFNVVCAGVLVLRRLQPDLSRAFRVPLVWPVGLAGIAICTYMMISLPGTTWLRFAGWLAAGLALYFLYGSRHSLLQKRS